MNVLRRISTLQLAALVGVVLAAAVASGFALASRNGGPTPPQRSLAQAIHHALHGRPVAGVSARIRFTNHLMPNTGSLGSGSPLLSGATGRLWASKSGRFRIELQSDNGDVQVVGGPSAITVYDASQNAVFRIPLGHHRHARHGHEQHALPTLGQIRHLLGRLGRAVQLSGALPGDIAGRPAYTVRVAPRHAAGLLGRLELAWDAARGVPLRVAVYSSTDSTPVLELRVTSIHYGPVPASDLTLRPPAGVHVTTIHPGAMHAAGSGRSGRHGVQAALSFRLRAPATLVGLPRQGVRSFGSGHDRGALVLYGHGLGGLLVLEQPAQSGHQALAQLPGVSVGGAHGHELATPLGTIVQWRSGGVSYTVAGSLPAAGAEAAARALR